MKRKIYVITNSHMDPIWLWRLREGRSTWINTCRTVVRMMEKYPFLKFTRSSSICYRWIEECDKQLFRKIVKLVDAGRWELIGGWVEQSDTIITPGESLLRQAEHAKKYFMDKFGRDVRIAYSVDSFGQNAGLPQILKKSGFDYYTYMRPMANEKAMPDSFRWKCEGGADEIITFRVRHSYCTQQHIQGEVFTEHFKKAIGTDEYSLSVFFFGVGDHGGGIYENQLHLLLSFQDQYDLEFCTLEHYFHQLEKKKLPVVTGELTHHSPGCYAAVGEIKEWMADCEKNLRKAEKLNLQIRSSDQLKESRKLYDAWDKLLFNYFHDIYSGTCIGDSYRHEIRDLCGAVNDTAVESMERSLCRIGSAVPSRKFMTEGGVLLWNPNSFKGRCVSYLDTYMDPNVVGSEFNCLRTADGREIPLQGIRGASIFGPCSKGWRRAVVLDTLNASEARIYAYGRSEKKYPDIGFKTQKALLKKFKFAVLADTGDTWGHGVKRLGETLGYMEMTGVEEMENGPVVSRLRVHYSWKNSSARVDLFQYAGIDPIFVQVRTDWRESDDTLKAVLKTPKKIASTVSGQASATLHRAADDCEQPFIDWVSAELNGQTKIGFLAHSLHGYDVVKNELRLTVLRPVSYAEHRPNKPCGDEGYADLGVQDRSFWCFSGDYSVEECVHLAQERLIGAEHLEVTAADGDPKFAFDRWEIVSSSVMVQSERILPDGTIQIHLLNTSAKPASAKILCEGKTLQTIRLAGKELRMLSIEKLNAIRK